MATATISVFIRVETPPGLQSYSVRLGAGVGRLPELNGEPVDFPDNADPAQARIALGAAVAAKLQNIGIAPPEGTAWSEVIKPYVERPKGKWDPPRSGENGLPAEIGVGVDFGWLQPISPDPSGNGVQVHLSLSAMV